MTVSILLLFLPWDCEVCQDPAPFHGLSSLRTVSRNQMQGLKLTRALVNNRKVTYDTHTKLTIVAVSSIVGAEPALPALMLLSEVLVLLHPASSPQSCPNDRVRALDGEHLVHLGQQEHTCQFPSWNNQTFVYTSTQSSDVDTSSSPWQLYWPRLWLSSVLGQEQVGSLWPGCVLLAHKHRHIYFTVNFIYLFISQSSHWDRGLTVWD